MTKEELDKIYSEVSKNAANYIVNKSYTTGKNAKIMTQEVEKQPDNRIAVPYGKKFVDFMTGYAGRNINVSYELVDETQTEEQEEVKETEYQQLMKEFSEHNDDDILVPKTYKEILSQENAYMLFWTSQELNLPGGMVTPEYEMIQANRGIMLYDKSLKPKKEAFVLFTEDELSNGKKVKYADIYYPYKSDRWTSTDNGDWALTDESFTTYPYERVPCIEFKMSEDGGPVFSAVRGMIDQTDKIVSKSADELERFANLTLVLPGLVDKETAEKLRMAILTMLDDMAKYPGDQWPKYLEKNLQGVSEYQKNLLDWIVDRIHECIGIPDIMDERFAGGAESGVARAFKLISMEYLASSIELYFFKGLYERKLMLDDVIKASMASVNPDDYTISVIAERSLPLDEQVKAQVAQTLKGIISDETLIEKVLGKIVGDPKTEMQRLEKQRENNPVLIPPTIDENTDGDV